MTAVIDRKHYADYHVGGQDEHGEEDLGKIASIGRKTE